MSQHRDREQSGRSIPTRPERVLDAFVDGAPRTVDDVAIAANVDTDVARATLEALVEDGTLTRRSVSGVDITERKAAEEADIDLDAEIDLWSLTPDELTEGQSDPATAEDRIDRRLERMTVPGASEMMQNWRRDAVRAAYERLDALDGDELTPAALRDDLFGTHEAGFDTPEAWWDFVRPRLYRLPGVTVEDGCWCVLSDAATDDPTVGPN